MKSLISKKNRSSRNRLSRKRLSSFSRKIQRGGMMTVDEAIRKLKAVKCPEATAKKYLENHPQKDLSLFVNGAIILYNAWNTKRVGALAHETKTWDYCLTNAHKYEDKSVLPKDTSYGKRAASTNVPVGLGARPIPTHQPPGAHEHPKQ